MSSQTRTGAANTRSAVPRLDADVLGSVFLVAALAVAAVQLPELWYTSRVRAAVVLAAVLAAAAAYHGGRYLIP